MKPLSHLVWVFFILASASVQAEMAPAPPPPLSGHYSFLGKVELLESRSIEFVRDVGTDEGAARLRELRADGYDCQLQAQEGGQDSGKTSYRCWNFLDLHALPAALEKKIAEKWARLLDVRALGPAESETLIHQSDAIIQWQIAQPMRVNGRQYPGYRLTQLAGVTKISFSPTPQDPSQEILFVILRNGDLQYVSDATENTGPDSQILDFVGLNLEHGQ